MLELAEAFAEIGRRYGRPEYHEPPGDPVIGPQAEDWRVIEPVKPVSHYDQMCLFALPTLEDRAESELPRLARKWSSRKARVRHLAEALQISERKAGRLYDKALDRYIRRARWAHYQRNRAWYEWIRTPAFGEYVTAYTAELDRRHAEREREYREAVAAGREHVVEIKRVEGGILARLDNESVGTIPYHGPWQLWIDQLRITEHDARVLIETGALHLVEGNAKTLISGHTFHGLGEPEARCEAAEPVDVGPERCAVCGVELEHNIVSLNVKLGYRPPRCLRCLDIDEAEARRIVRYYKDSGCTMFV